MSEMITVNQDKLEVVRGLAQDSIITCTRLSAPDVFVAIITQQETTNLLSEGDSTAEPRLTRVRIHLFRRSVDDHSPFSATVSIADAPPPNHKAADHTLAVAFHAAGTPTSASTARRATRKRKK